MKVFEYEGILEGRRVKGKIEAESKEKVLELLEQKGIIPLNVSEKKVRNINFQFNFELKRVPFEDIAFSLLQISTLLEAGIPLTETLRLVANQVENEKLSAALLQIKKDIERGKSVAQAFRDSGLFPQFLAEMLEGAQTGENLEFIFKIAGEYLQKLSEIRSKIISSLIYPLLVISSSFLALIVAVKVVLPKLVKVLESFGKEPPFITKLLMFSAELFTYALPVAFAGFIYFYIKRKEITSSHSFGRFLLKIPVIGKIVLYINLARFAKVCSMLLKASVPLTETLKLAAASISLPFLREEIEKLIPEVEKGKSFSQLLRKIEFIPPLFVNLWETGESGGELEKMTELLAETFEKQVLRKIEFWIKMIEPITILFIAFIVGLIAVSVILPMSNLSMGLK